MAPIKYHLFRFVWMIIWNIIIIKQINKETILFNDNNKFLNVSDLFVSVYFFPTPMMLDKTAPINMW